MLDDSLIEILLRDFESIQSKLKLKPVLGAPKWILMGYNILGDGLIQLDMEDGHIENNAIVKYVKTKDCFNIVEQKEAI